MPKPPETVLIEEAKRTADALRLRTPFGPLHIGIVGSRRRGSQGDFRLCERVFAAVYRARDSIVSGGCPQGADAFAETIARNKGVTITIHYPRKEDLDQDLLRVNAKAAWARVNYARNQQIALSSDLLIAFVTADRKGGTEDTVKRMEDLNRPVILVF